MKYIVQMIHLKCIDIYQQLYVLIQQVYLIFNKIAKFNELLYNIPPLQEICRYFDLNSNDKKMLVNIEYDVLKEYINLYDNRIDYNVSRPTYTSFIYYFGSIGYIFDDDTINSQHITNDDFENINEFRSICTNIFIRDCNLQQYPKSLIASSIIATSRKYSNFDKIWRNELEEITTYKYIELEEIINILSERINSQDYKQF